MIPQQMQLQQIQIQSGLSGQGQPQFVSQSDQQQIQNQLMQSQQIVLQQQAQGGPNAAQSNGIQQITIQQPKQILVGQQSVAQSQATIENRPIMTMVPIGSGNNTSPLNAMQNLTSPLSTSQQITLQPQPNPLAAMTSLSYSASPSVLTNTIANIQTKEDKATPKADETQKSTAPDTSTVTTSVVTTITNGTMTISSSKASPTVKGNYIFQKYISIFFKSTLAPKNGV